MNPHCESRSSVRATLFAPEEFNPQPYNLIGLMPRGGERRLKLVPIRYKLWIELTRLWDANRTA